MKIMINTKRNGYDTEQCGKTLTVGELIELLSDYDSNTPIYLKHDGGYSYGSITSYDLEEEGDDEMKIYYNNKRISKKDAIKIFGQEKFEYFLKEAKAEYAKDPYTELSFANGLRFEFGF